MTSSALVSYPKMLAWAISIALAILGSVLLLHYPVFRPLLTGFLLIFGVSLLKWPRVWLAVLPASVPLLELAHWSGRLFLEDLDIVFIFTLAALLWQAKSATSQPLFRLPLRVHLVVSLLLLSYLSSLLIGLLPWPNWGAPDFLANFLSQANALRMFKGFFWAMLFSPFVLKAFQEYPAESKKMVIGGMVAGGLVIGLMAMWERGVWHALIYGRDLYQILNPLLDFTTPYRVTGTFAEMHTGGEAIDGYLGLAWPMLVLALGMSRKPWTLVVSSIVLGLVIYSLVTTFSRGLYFSLALGSAVWLIGLVRVFRVKQQAEAPSHPWALLLWLALTALLMGLGYSRGGMTGLLGVLGMFGVVSMLAWRPLARVPTAMLILTAFGFGIWVAAQGMLTSKWHPLPLSSAVPFALLFTGGGALLGYTVGRSLPRGTGFKPYLVAVMVLVVGAGTLVPALMGYRMTSRLSDASTDLSTRTKHWHHAIALKNGQLSDLVFGMGLGSFPRAYHWDTIYHDDSSGDFSLLNENGNTFLRTTGGKGLRFGQRLSVAAMQPMHMQMAVRSASPQALLRVRLCRRFVIQPWEWNSDCITLDQVLKNTQDQWQTILFNLNTGKVGDGLEMARAPLMLEINNRREYDLMAFPPARIDIDNISLKDAYGNEYVANGSFESNMDRWLPYYDFNHLPWHIKNLWLHLYFEQGWLGVIAFAGAWIIALTIAWRSTGKGEIFALGVAAALTGFVAVGTFGSPIDAPRVAWLYYFLLFVLIAQYRRRPRLHSDRGAKKRHSKNPDLTPIT